LTKNLPYTVEHDFALITSSRQPSPVRLLAFKFAYSHSCLIHWNEACSFSQSHLSSICTLMV